MDSLRAGTAFAMVLATAAVTFGGNSNDSMQWATVGSPGNAPYSYYDEFEQKTFYSGSVAHEFRITRTEVTAAQYIDFVQAYAPYVDPDYRTNAEFTSLQLGYEFDDGQIVYTLDPQTAPYPVEVGWRFAARFVNWLHNDRGTSREAFETGVYDTSTFHTNPDGTITDQVSHSPDAEFWIPTRDEWLKAGYFDPHRYGLNEPGYWRYPHSSDVPPVPGPPGMGETSHGYDVFFDTPVAGAYELVQSPSGLWDMSGGVAEWVEDLHSNRIRGIMGSERGGIYFPFVDEIRYGGGGSSVGGLTGFRVAARVVPPPAASWLLFAVGLTFFRRKRT